MKPYSAAKEWVEELDIAEGLKKLVTDAGLTIESTVRLGNRESTEILHIDPYVGKLIVDAAQKVIQEKYTQKEELIIYKY
ncbi:MAG TPA: hypothetical protein VE130_02800 [Nitrososphaeraceae archaeon]|jgi:hypothetical protein|nr:hypothetical protein [Nitrososphaeraceae archaeon]